MVLRVYLEVQLPIKYLILSDKALNKAKNSEYDGYQRGFSSMVYEIFEKNLLFTKDQELILETYNLQKNHTSKLLENLKNCTKLYLTCTLLLKTIFRMKT